MGQAFCGTEGRDHGNGEEGKVKSEKREDILADLALATSITVCVPPNRMVKLEAKWRSREKRTREIHSSLPTNDPMHRISEAQFQRLVSAYSTDSDDGSNGYTSAVLSQPGLAAYSKDLAKMLDKAWLVSFSLSELDMTPGSIETAVNSVMSSSSCGAEAGVTTVNELLRNTREHAKKAFLEVEWKSQNSGITAEKAEDAAVMGATPRVRVATAMTTPESSNLEEKPRHLIMLQTSPRNANAKARTKPGVLKSASMARPHSLAIRTAAAQTTTSRRPKTQPLKSKSALSVVKADNEEGSQNIANSLDAKDMLHVRTKKRSEATSHTTETPPREPNSAGDKWRAASLKVSNSVPAESKRVNIFEVLKDPEVRAEYRRREAESVGSGKLFLKRLTRKRRAEASSKDVKFDSMHSVVDAAVHRHRIAVRKLLKNSWVRSQYQACEKVKRGSGVALLRRLAEPGALEKAMLTAGVTLSEQATTQSADPPAATAGSAGTGARSKADLLALVRKKKEQRNSKSSTMMI